MAGCKAYRTRARRKGGRNRPVTLELKLIYIRFFPPIDPHNNIHTKLAGLNESNCSMSLDFIEELLRMKMGLLVFMRNVLLALCLFLVLGFLYYSAWKLHLFQWEDSTGVDDHVRQLKAKTISGLIV